jgi:hypothetical protein
VRDDSVPDNMMARFAELVKFMAVVSGLHAALGGWAAVSTEGVCIRPHIMKKFLFLLSEQVLSYSLPPGPQTQRRSTITR